MDEPAWDAWFNAQYDTFQKVKSLVDEATRGKSNAFRVAVVMGIMESLSELARFSIDLPDADAKELESDG